MNNQPDIQAREREHFDQLAALTQETWWGNQTPAGAERLRRRARLIAQAADAWTEPHILELGCGTGSLTEALLQERPEARITASDISPVAIEIAQKRCSRSVHSRFEVGDSSSLSYPDATFDLVIGSSILHHLPAEQTLRECYRVLKSGGMICFSEPNMLNPQIAIEKNIHFLGKYLDNTEDETAFFRWRLSRMLKRLGFDNVQVRPYDFLHPLVPKPLIPAVVRISGWLEKVPLLREISGSLWITGFKRLPEP